MQKAFNHDTDQLEDVFAIQITKQSGSNQLVNSYASEVNGGRGGDIVINSAYINKFEINDERGKFVYINPVNNRRLTSKYTNEFGDVPLVRLAEMYLIRAESNFREGTAVGDTYTNDINLLRNRAKATPFANPTLTDILRERELELGMEGFRIHDIKRTKGSVDSSLPWDSDLLVFPIPLYETNTNKKITQNTGY
ncbi:MAG: RagB/SusD family nutrient uptake outer membrane protein [Flavobacterium sp.]|nr:MAG: RagB/SusD family nutrient uptake outer membrane protein [Flavobacterium sp.]